MRRLFAKGLLLLAAGCGGTATAADDDAATPRDDASSIDASAPPVDAFRVDTGVPTTTSTLAFGPFSTRRGVETTQCVVLDLGNERPAMLRSIRTRLTPGSHHVIVARADDETGPSSARPCSPFAAGVENTIFIAQAAEAGLDYPDGAGLRLRARQLIGIEMHMINYFSDTPIDIAASVELELAEAGAPLREVQLLFTGDLALILPPQRETTVTNDFAVPDGTEVFALTSHTHRLGTYASLEIVGAGAPPELVHESRSWADPPLDTFSPPRVFGPRQSLRLTCTYLNDTDETVTFGENFDEEMCFLWAYYLDPA